MPLYSATAPVTALYSGDSFTIASAESPATGQASVCFTLAPNQFSNSGYAFSVEGIFSGAPGTFSFQMQESNTNAAADFVNIGSAITTGTVWRVDFTAQAGRFYRLSYATQTQNSVTFSANAYRV